jgi:hypothetical protein
MPCRTVKTLNGLNTSQMFDTIDALNTQPSLARFQCRASNTWINGGENRSTIKGFYGAGREDDSRTEPFELTNGEPPVLLGANEGANPVEVLLHALAGCVTTTTVLHAAARGFTLRSCRQRWKARSTCRGCSDSTMPCLSGTSRSASTWGSRSSQRKMYG